MAEPEKLRSSEGLGRLIAFADAVVAIALTLLVLPLVDIANDLREYDETSVAEVVSDHSLEITSFFVSFVVIWVLWRQHHRTMEYFRSYDSVLINLHFVWLLTIVVLPFATAIVDDSRVEWGSVLYIGVLCGCGGRTGGYRAVGQHRDPLRRRRDDRCLGQDVRGWGTVIALTVALIVALVDPKSGNWPLLLLFLTDPIERLIARVRGTDA